MSWKFTRKANQRFQLTKILDSQPIIEYKFRFAYSWNTTNVGKKWKDEEGTYDTVLVDIDSVIADFFSTSKTPQIQTSQKNQIPYPQIFSWNLKKLNLKYIQKNA